jgi:hypothetical protein
MELWIPAVLGVVAFFQLRTLLRREANAIAVCQPGETVEVIGLGPVIATRQSPEPASGLEF